MPSHLPAKPQQKSNTLSVKTVTPQTRRPAPLRKRKRANTGCLTGLLYFFFVVGISAMLASFGWMAASEVMGFSRSGGMVTVTINPDDTITDITNTLEKRGLIQYPWLFQLYASLSEAEDEIVPGTYTIDSSLDYMAIVNAMKKNSLYRSEVKVTIPEGFTLEQIFERLAENGVCTEEALWNTSQLYTSSYSYIAVLPKTYNRLEGYLFPDTDDYYVGDDPVRVIRKMLDNFDSKLTDNMRARAKEMGLTIHEVVTIASMIEREAKDFDDALLISSVIHNRLNNPEKYPFLQIDATIIYALPEHKTALTDADKEIDSPYNTYKYKGLPPGPICSPGRSSLEAALDPADTGYYFYAINKDGVHQFSKTLEEHNKVLAELGEAED